MHLSTLTLTAIILAAGLAFGAEADGAINFDPQKNLLSLHYDHAPDKDDGHSAAADRTILETLYDCEWIKAHVVAVSGAYGNTTLKNF